jgi:hypothetical protein
MAAGLAGEAHRTGRLYGAWLDDAYTAFDVSMPTSWLRRGVGLPPADSSGVLRLRPLEEGERR